MSSSAHSAQWWLEIHTKPHTTQTQLLKVSAFLQEKGCLSEHRPWGRKRKKKKTRSGFGKHKKKKTSVYYCDRNSYFLIVSPMTLLWVHVCTCVFVCERERDWWSVLGEATGIMDVMTQQPDSSEPHNTHRDGWRHSACWPDSVFALSLHYSPIFSFNPAF